MVLHEIEGLVAEDCAKELMANMVSSQVNTTCPDS